MRILIIALGLILSTGANETKQQLCAGFLPPNDLSIPVAGPGWLSVTGLTEARYHAVLDRIERVMTTQVAERGGKLVVSRLWESAEVNAYAEREDDRYIIEMHGGLARYPLMTEDGFLMVACHEMGHHLGGAPFYFWFGNMSNEGQSDYYASLKCFRLMYSLEENQAWAATAKVPEYAVQECARHKDENDVLSCQRAIVAGVVLGHILSGTSQGDPKPVLGQPDPTVVPITFDNHPGAQCRLDTYVNGAICDRLVTEKLSDTDYRQGTCEKVDGYTYGFRPRCWFKPPHPDPVEEKEDEVTNGTGVIAGLPF